MFILTIIFAVAVFLIIYHHVLYPIILRWFCRLKASKHRALSSLSDDQLPTLCMVIPAFNEAQFIEEKIRNLAFLDYPRDKFNVFIACDGCTDNTVELAEREANYWKENGLNLRVLNFKKNRGKLAVLNQVVPSRSEQIIVFSDVSALVSIDALRFVAEGFVDDSVGAVNGNYRLLSPGSSGERDYWKYQSALKQAEESLGSVLGAHGAFYAIRRKLFRPIQEDTINDDFVIPMNIVADGYRVIYEERINAVELERSDRALEWRRRIRIGMGNMQQVIRLKSLFLPRYKGVSFAFFSGKGLRVFMPFLMIYCYLFCCFAAFLHPIFLAFLVLQTFVYLLALNVYVYGEEKRDRVSKAVFYLVSGYIANLVGAFKLFTHSKRSW